MRDLLVVAYLTGTCDLTDNYLSLSLLAGHSRVLALLHLERVVRH